MNPNMIKCGVMAALAGLAGCGEVNNEEAACSKAPVKRDSQSTVKETVVTNDDGSVTRTKTESKEIKDADGNVIGHETSTYSETTYGDDGADLAESAPGEAKGSDEVAAADGTKSAGDAKAEAKAAAKAADSFLGLKFGESVPGSDKAEDVAGEPTLKVVKFTPAKGLKGFDDYYAFVTPKTHKLVKVCACAKEAVDAGAFGRHHYLVEALENRYRKWARLASFHLPLYTLDITPDRGVSVCLAGASEDYETVITAWDNAVARQARAEYREIREEAYRAAMEARNARVKEAESAF